MIEVRDAMVGASPPGSKSGTPDESIPDAAPDGSLFQNFNPL